MKFGQGLRQDRWIEPDEHPFSIQKLPAAIPVDQQSMVFTNPPGRRKKEKEAEGCQGTGQGLKGDPGALACKF